MGIFNGKLTSAQTAPVWATGKVYAVNDLVIESQQLYICIVGHTSGTFATDLASDYWVLASGSSGSLEVEALNQTGSTITKGTPVTIYQATGTVPRMILSSASGTNEQPCIGLVSADVTNGSTGSITVFGLIENINTSSFSQGANLFVGTSAGTLSASAPNSGFRQPVASVVVQNAATGKLFVYRGGELPIATNTQQGILTTVAQTVGGKKYFFAGSKVNLGLELIPQGSSPTPDGGAGILWESSVDDHLYYKSDSGTERPVTKIFATSQQGQVPGPAATDVTRKYTLNADGTWNKDIGAKTITLPTSEGGELEIIAPNTIQLKPSRISETEYLQVFTGGGGVWLESTESDLVLQSAEKIVCEKPILLPEQASAPPTYSGYNALYPKTDGKLYYKEDSVAEKQISHPFIGDSGSGGEQGQVPAPASGDATKFLKGDGTWGDVLDPIYLQYTGNGGTSLTANTTNADWSTLVVDSHSAWSGTVFTAPRAGWYEIKGSALATAGNTHSFLLYKNGTANINATNFDLSSARKGISASIYLNASDTISFRSDISITLSNNATNHWISIASQV